MPSHPFRLLTALVLATTMWAAACSSDDDGADADADVTATDDTATDDTPTTQRRRHDDTDDTDEGDEGDGETTTTTEAAAELTDSFRGVTAESIKVGFIDVDFEELNATFGLDLQSPDTGVIVEALVDDLNARGGVNGRRVEVVVEKYLPANATIADEVCLKMVEDEEVFAVLGGFGGPGSEESNSCITGPGETILVGGRLTDERLDQATAPWITPDMNATRRGPAFVRALADSGELEGLGTLGVHAVLPDQDPTADVIRDALTEAGATVALRSTGQAGDDQFAATTETEVMLERARAEGVDSIVVVGVSPTITDTILATDEFTVVVPNTEEVAGLEHPTFSEGDRMIGTGSIASLDDPELAACVERATEAVGAGAIPADANEGDLSFWTSTLRACRNFTLFEAVAVEAGPDLTNESFAAALATTELPPLPVYPFASLGPDKPDARDTLSVLEWDAGLADFVEISGPFDVEA